MSLSSLQEGPDLLVHSGIIRTQSVATPVVSALAVRQGRVLATGHPDELRAHLSPDCRELDLRGRTLVPGFVDGHCHLEMTCDALDQHIFVQAPPIKSIAELLLVAANARRSRPRGWIMCRSSFMLQDKVEERRLPTQAELDSVSPTEPLVVLAGLHVACLNTAAFKALDFPRRIPPTATAHRDARGDLTGVFTEIWDMFPTADPADILESLRRHLRPSFTSQGVTTVCTIPTSADDVRALHRLSLSGELPLRVRFYVHVPRTAELEDVLQWGVTSGFGDDRLQFGGVKIFVDGEGGDGLGNPIDDTKWTRDALFSFVARADAADVQLLMHAVTPKAIRLAAEAVIAAREKRNRRDGPRHRIEHAADYLDPLDLPLLKQADVGVVATPHFNRSAGVADSGFQPLRQIIDAGFRPIGSSDSTGTVPDGIAPLVNIAAAVNRREVDGAPSPHQISAQEALNMFTTWSAYGAHLDSNVGSLLPGQLADFAVLDADPLSTAPEDIESISVLATAVGGVIEHDAVEERK